MAQPLFTLQALKQVLIDGAGAADGVGLDGDILDASFPEIGYDSLALLETGGRIERAYGIDLDESALADARTPRQLIDVVNTQLAGAVGR